MAPELWTNLVVAVPAAVAVIVVVGMFLRFMREERVTRAQEAAASHAVLEKLRDGMDGLGREIRESLPRG